jgi:polyhydroxybutyrate depolymerase
MRVLRYWLETIGIAKSPGKRVRVRTMTRGWATLLSLGALLCAAPSAGAEEMHIPTEDGPRRAVVLTAARGTAPTVLVLHGFAGSPDRTIRRSGFAEAAARRGFTAVFPQAKRWQWNDGRVFRPSGADDVGFLKGLVRELVARRVAEPERIYIVGVSNGGMMTFRMLCEASELFAGAGTVIANMPARVGRDCLPDLPVTLVMFNGTADPLVPYEGGDVGVILHAQVWAAEHTARFLARDFRCGAFNEAGIGSGMPGPTQVSKLEWSRCTMERSVTLYRVEGGGHQIFGHRSTFAFAFGPGGSPISAPETIMEAFARREEEAGTARYASGRPALRSPSR